MNLKLIIIALSVCLPSVLATANELETQITKQYQNHILALRDSIPEEGQDFDSDGKPMKTSSGSPWMLYSGLLYVNKVTIKADSLNLEGTSLIYFNANHSSGFPFGHPLKIRFHLDHQLHSADEARQLMDRVFFLDEESLQRAKPEYRRSGEPDEPIYRWGLDKDVLRPIAKYTPDPEMSAEARKARYQGTVVVRVVIDKNGLVSRISVERALGMGLDAQAVSAVRNWRFQPATREGQPVAVEMIIQTTFELH
jgi:TonB family protein